MVQLTGFAALLVSAGLLLAGNGLFGTLIAVRANLEAFEPTTIGLLGSAFFAGWITGAVLCPQLMQRAGHIRAFAAMAALYAASALLHAMLVHPILWMLLRAAGGFCFAGLAIIVESWLNARTPNADRGRVLGIYRLVDLSSVTAGQFLLTLADPRGFELFSITALLLCFCLVPLAMTKVRAPSPPPALRLRIGRLFRVSPLGATGVFAVGLVNGTFRMLTPSIAQDLGLSVAQIASLISAFIVGGAAMQVPLGWLSDAWDRRGLLLVSTLGALIAGIGMSVAAVAGPTTFIAAGFVFGAFALPIYSLAVAHANDFAEENAFIEVSAGLFLLYGVGAMIGPFLGSATVALFGSHALFYYTSAVHAVLLLFGAYRATARRSVPRALRRQYVALLRTSPNIFRLDPRGRSR